MVMEATTLRSPASGGTKIEMAAQPPISASPVLNLCFAIGKGSPLDPLGGVGVRLGWWL
jgi:hypothetical protein